MKDKLTRFQNAPTYFTAEDNLLSVFDPSGCCCSISQYVEKGVMSGNRAPLLSQNGYPALSPDQYNVRTYLEE
jgi:hypothetical protein